MDKKIIVLKVGGSILSLSEEQIFDFEKANELKLFLNEFIEQGFQFALITGGGYICRKYQKLLMDQNISEFDQHYIGTCTCNLNAIMLRSVFGDLALNEVITFNDFENEEPLNMTRPVVIGGAAKPGPSSDYDAFIIAKKIGSKSIISLKDVDGVYSEDPKKNPNAVRLDSVSWDEYLKIIGNPNAHMPGGNLPVDPIASKSSQENGISFTIVDGKNLDNLKNLLKNQEFVGTVIR